MYSKLTWNSSSKTTKTSKLFQAQSLLVLNTLRSGGSSSTMEEAKVRWRNFGATPDAEHGEKHMCAGV